MLKRRKTGLALTAAIGAAALAAPAVANATDYVVTTNNDSATLNSCDGTTNECDTLRDAVNAANNDPNDDTITFDSSLSGQTITLTAGEIGINANQGVGSLTIQGLPGHTPTISGDANGDGNHNKSGDPPDSRIFYVSGDGEPITLSGLTLSGGYAYGRNNGREGGGAIWAGYGTNLTVSDDVFSGNAASGDSSEYDGGAIYTDGALTVSGSSFTDNHADNGYGGAIYADRGATIRNSTISGSSAREGGGVATDKYSGPPSTNSFAIRQFVETHTPAQVQAKAATMNPQDFIRSTLDISDSTITGNTAKEAGGGLYSPTLLKLKNSTVSSNDGGFSGGGIESSGKYAQSQIDNSTISSNTALQGAGMDVGQFYGNVNDNNPATEPTVKHAVQSSISRSTISGNTAGGEGGGINVLYLAAGDRFDVENSTLSSNKAGGSDYTGFGGGINFSQEVSGELADGGAPIAGQFRTINSTISGNSATTGGGVSLGGDPQSQNPRVPSELSGPLMTDEGSIDFENSTIASNTASSNGGGVYLNSYYNAGSDAVGSPTLSLTSTIVGDNNAGGGGNDADRADGSSDGGLDSTDSLVENVGDAPFVQNTSTITGADPQLGALGDNGGPTQTQLPAVTSPVIDKGDAPARLNTDQRGQNRTVEGGAGDVTGGDGTDIGAVEVQNPAQNPQTVAALPQFGDNTPPVIGLKVPHSLSIAQLIRGFNVTVICNEPCAMTFRLYGSAPTGTLHSAGYNFRLLNRKIGRKGGKRKVHLRPCVAGSHSKHRTHVCRKRITKALLAKPQKRFKVKLIVAAKDVAGNVSHKKKFIKVHR